MPDPYKRNDRTEPLKAARFYCEHCGHEVPFNAEICPHCKKTFSSVRCPQCGFSGHPDRFLNGCPHCGFISSRSAIGRRRASTVEAGKKTAKPRRRQDIFTPLALVGALVLLGAILFFYFTR